MAVRSGICFTMAARLTVVRRIFLIPLFAPSSLSRGNGDKLAEWGTNITQTTVGGGSREPPPLVMKYISPDLHALLWCEIEFPVSHVEKSVPVVEECHDDIDAVLGD